MTNKNKTTLLKVCITTGICLVVAGALALVFWQGNITLSKQKAESYVSALTALIPEPQGATAEERRDNNMSVLSIDGKDFVGMLEMPRYELVLPICAEWKNINRCPCRFSGSVYDKSMQIGATTQNGQFDFYRQISVGDTVKFTDVEGNVYTYAITNLRYERRADKAALEREDSALTLFVKNIYGFEYLIISCNTVA